MGCYTKVSKFDRTSSAKFKYHRITTGRLAVPKRRENRKFREDYLRPGNSGFTFRNVFFVRGLIWSYFFTSDFSKFCRFSFYNVKRRSFFRDKVSRILINLRSKKLAYNFQRSGKAKPCHYLGLKRALSVFNFYFRNSKRGLGSSFFSKYPNIFEHSSFFLLNKLFKGDSFIKSFFVNKDKTLFFKSLLLITSHLKARKVNYRLYWRFLMGYLVKRRKKKLVSFKSLYIYSLGKVLTYYNNSNNVAVFKGYKVLLRNRLLFRKFNLGYFCNVLFLCKSFYILRLCSVLSRYSGYYYYLSFFSYKRYLYFFFVNRGYVLKFFYFYYIKFSIFLKSESELLVISLVPLSWFNSCWHKRVWVYFNLFKLLLVFSFRGCCFFNYFYLLNRLPLSLLGFNLYSIFTSNFRGSYLYYMFGIRNLSEQVFVFSSSLGKVFCKFVSVVYFKGLNKSSRKLRLCFRDTVKRYRDRRELYRLRFPYITS